MDHLPWLWLWLWLWLSLLLFIDFAPALQSGFSVRIDCGGSSNFTNEFNQTWLADSFYTGGVAAEVSEPGRFLFQQEKTLRYFPVREGKRNCYAVNVPSGRYYIRMFFVYDNYDNKRHPPNFDVSIEGTVVFSWRSDSWSGESARTGAYSDLITFVDDDEATVCLYSIATDPPTIGALEIVQVDPEMYSSQETGSNVILVNYGRFTGGDFPFGPGLSNDRDEAGRVWESDHTYSFSASTKLVLSTNQPIRGADRHPNYFPPRLYQTAHTLQYSEALEFMLPVDPTLDYMLWFHFAEIDAGVDGPWQRVFDIVVSNEIVFASVDIMKEAGKFTAYDLQHIVRNLTNSTLSVKLVPQTGSPLICGLEIYALLVRDLLTDPIEGAAMQSLKQSLQIPERMGWNGDPCAPSDWDAWEGVSCYLSANDKTLVITHLDLSNQGLRGILDEKITLLSHLQHLNLSSNKIEGNIPEGLGENSLMTVDLSSNNFSGSIPESLASKQLTTVLLSSNLLQGQVPESLYSIGVHGGYINLTNNKGLCGVPSLPSCSYWSSEDLPNRVKVVIASTVFAILSILILIVYIVMWRKQKNDYSFDLPQQLTSKRNYYQRQNPRLIAEGDENELMKSVPTKFGFASNINPI